MFRGAARALGDVIARERPLALVSTYPAFAFEGHVWQSWRDALEPLARPYAAKSIGRQVLANAAPCAHASERSA